MLNNSAHTHSDFAYQINNWAFPQAKKALAGGFFIETIGISVNAINAILRECILSKVMEDEEYFDEDGNPAGVETYDEHPYLVHLLTDYDHPLTGGLGDNAFYVEAKRLRIINKTTFAKLTSLYQKRNKIFHRLFGGVILHKTTLEPNEGLALIGHVMSLHEEKLKVLATEYLRLFTEFIKIAKIYSNLR